MTMTKAELKTKLNDIIDKKTHTYSIFMAGTINDLQTKEVMSRIDAELLAFNAVLDALNGDSCMINCY